MNSLVDYLAEPKPFWDMSDYHANTLPIIYCPVCNHCASCGKEINSDHPWCMKLPQDFECRNCKNTRLATVWYYSVSDLRSVIS